MALGCRPSGPHLAVSRATTARKTDYDAVDGAPTLSRDVLTSAAVDFRTLDLLTTHAARGPQPQLPCATTFPDLSVRRSSGGQHEYVRQLWTHDGDSDKNVKQWQNGQTGRDRGADRLCAGLDRRSEAGAPA